MTCFFYRIRGPLRAQSRNGKFLFSSNFNCEVKKMTDVMAERENAFAEGKEEGRAAGFAEGASAERTKADQEKRQMAKSLKEQNVDVSIIAKSTGFSEEEILSL